MFCFDLYYTYKVLGVSAGSTVKIWDVEHQAEKYGRQVLSCVLTTVTWLVCGLSYDLWLLWPSCDHHVTVMWPACDCHVMVMWPSCDHHVTVMWWSFDAALGGHEDTVQSFSWRGDGSLLATICKVCMIHKNGWYKRCLDPVTTLCVILQDNREKKLRVFDPRANSSSGVSSHIPILRPNCTIALCHLSCTRLQEVKVHSGQKDSRVLWLGDSNYVVTAGFSIVRVAPVT